MSDEEESIDELGVDLEGVTLPISEEWRIRANDALVDLDKERQWLAAEVGTTKTTITDLLSTTKTSHLVGAVSKALGIAVPYAEITDHRELVWLAAGKALRKLSPLDFDKELDKVARLISKFRKEAS